MKNQKKSKQLTGMEEVCLFFKRVFRFCARNSKRSCGERERGQAECECHSKASTSYQSRKESTVI